MPLELLNYSQAHEITMPTSKKNQSSNSNIPSDQGTQATNSKHGCLWRTAEPACETDLSDEISAKNVDPYATPFEKWMVFHYHLFSKVSHDMKTRLGDTKKTLQFNQREVEDVINTKETKNAVCIKG